MTYLNGNSLGPMPKASEAAISNFLNDEWKTELIKGWNTKNWFMHTNTLGDRIARLIGAKNGTTVVGDTLSIKVFQAVAAGLAMQPNRKVILSDNGNFPSDLYMAEGLINLKADGYSLKTPNPEEINSVHEMIKDVVQSRFPKTGLESVLYGGSVNYNNASSLFKQTNIDGALIGGASLDGREFALIANVFNKLRV